MAVRRAYRAFSQNTIRQHNEIDGLHLLANSNLSLQLCQIRLQDIVDSDTSRSSALWSDSREDFGDGSGSFDASIPASSDTLIWGATISGLMVHEVEIQTVVVVGGNDRCNNS